MKTPPDSPTSDPRWDALVRRAKADTPPPVDLPALLRAVSREPLPRRGWSADFSLGFNPRRLLVGCALGTGACALLASWEIWDVWQSLPWAQWLSGGLGGIL